TTITTTFPDTTKPNPSRPLYFAYGSNLSAVQMRMRCTNNPALSGNPVAIGRLEGWRWIICEAGYANVLPPRELRVEEQVKATTVDDGCKVWGVLYEMAPEDEFLLDGYENVDHSSGLASIDLGGVRPREQGEGHYNKWYLPATITMWLDGEQEKARGGGGKEIVLVYVDEKRVRMGPPKEEYVGRMNRAIREAEELGVDRVWVRDVMRRFIP
ncbi:gamma-glutamylcyclotransferase family protein, partial [Aspergillus ruber CBS 135680]